jgi:hypothetical protein
MNPEGYKVLLLSELEEKSHIQVSEPSTSYQSNITQSLPSNSLKQYFGIPKDQIARFNEIHGNKKAFGATHYSPEPQPNIKKDLMDKMGSGKDLMQSVKMLSKKVSEESKINNL